MRVGAGDWIWQAGAPGGVGLWRIPGLEASGAGAAFSSRLGGCSPFPWESLNLGLGVGDEAGRVALNRHRFASAAGFAEDAVARVHQVHGADVVLVVAPGFAGAGDGLCTDRPGVVLSIAVADCAAVYLMDAARAAVGLCHAGWRGIVADVVGRTIAVMQHAFGSRPEELVAAVSPCIGPCCYEVAEPVLGAVRAAVPWARQVLLDRPGGHAMFDLWAANRHRLLDAGIRADHIHAAGICTACRSDALYSHRRDQGRTGRMQAALWLPEQ